MILTNKQNLPEQFINFAQDANNKHSYKPHRYSVTELLLPVREIILNRIYDKELEEDVSDCIPALFGTAVHKIMEENASSDSLVETELELEIGSDVLTGICDSLKLKEQLIEDYKTCSTSKIMKQDFKDWKDQGLMYALMAIYKYRVIIKKLRFYALMKDWSKVKASNNPKYPQSPIYVWEYNINDSDYDYISLFIKTKLNLINETLATDIIPECTKEETWDGLKCKLYCKCSKVCDKKGELK